MSMMVRTPGFAHWAPLPWQLISEMLLRANGIFSLPYPVLTTVVDVVEGHADFLQGFSVTS
jgi:hypothetical protein